MKTKDQVDEAYDLVERAASDFANEQWVNGFVELRLASEKLSFAIDCDLESPRVKGAIKVISMLQDGFNKAAPREFRRRLK